MNKSIFLFSMMCLLGATVANGQATAVAVKGTPYLDDKYVDGVVFYASKSLTVPIRYNAFQDLIEYQQNGKPLVLDPTTTIKKVQLGTAVFVPQAYDKKLGYFAMLDSGKVTLYSKKKIILLPGRKGGALDGSDQPPEYKPNPDVFYYKIGDGPLQEVSSIKSMIASLPDKQDELTQFAKKEKISPRKEKEMLQFVQYYNSLSKE
ncbi:hypothetical protein [Chryseolinea lacunae]|uniref:DUF4384 domain-containing protein n=1 Tax=Chryseolinea lacunae TaxID=2801331 RepID=A0ABS1KM42_9BACT|nr:hypothetical protein [Chryseolinea lacunae]MBL0740506.1 hypothetical protein [Chryseolinea lacunae]